MKLRLWEDGRATEEFILEKPLIRIGRDPSCEVALDPVTYRKVSSLHAQLKRLGDEFELAPLSKSNQTLVNDVPVDRAVRVKVGDRIRLGFTGPTIEIISAARESPLPRSARVAPKPASDDPPATLLGVDAHGSMRSNANVRFSIGQGGIIGRDAKHATFVLDHPQVSRIHARLSVANGKTSLADLGSSNGTFCNGVQIDAHRFLVQGDTVDIGPYGLIFEGESLVGRSRADNVQLSIAKVDYSVSGSTNCEPLYLLHQVELVINPGEFLCILGPSGSGKSTLLNVMSGRRRPSAGKVFVNGRNLHENFSALKQDLAVVPQSSVLHHTLTVSQSFRFTSQLRLPSDLSDAEVASAVDATLQTVGLLQRRDLRISQLSGGQLKRAGLGGELLSNPSLLFLDEVTSGLDEHSDGEMMQLFRTLADNGKTLICVTHNLAHVEENCHLVAILTVGGRLAFFGTPLEALKYFHARKLADIYSELQSQAPDVWAEKFRKCEMFQKYVAHRMVGLRDEDGDAQMRSVERRRVSALRQFNVLLRRTIAVWKGDWAALAALFGQALLVAFLLCLVFGNLEDIDSREQLTRFSSTHNLLFLVTVSCFWLGCNNSVKEIVKERSIYQRERAYNLIPEAYLLSKLCFMGLIGIAQSILLSSITFAWFGMPGDVVAMATTMLLLSITGTALGLAISSNAKNEEVAVALVPVVVIPQIILAGVVASLPDLAEWIARATVSVYWGTHAVNDCLPSSYKTDSDFQPGYNFSMTTTSIHAVVFLALAWLGVRRHRS